MLMNLPHPRLRPSHRLSRGFTLIELVLVLTIIIVLVGSGIYIINQQGVLDTAQETRISGDIQAISAQLEVYQARNGRYPTTEQGLAALVEKPSKDPLPERWTRLMDEIPTDPWKQPYHYTYPAQKSKKPYDIFSIGKDGVANTPDDIGNFKSPEAKK